jgi:hypothetical protein
MSQTTDEITITVHVSKTRMGEDHGTLTFEINTRDGNFEVLAIYYYPDSRVARMCCQ